MKFAVSTYSFGSYISEDKLGIFGVIDKVKEMGFDGIEFTEGEWQGDLSFERAKEVGEYAQSKGLELVNYCICADFINGCAGDLDKEIERVKKQIDYAEALGVKKGASRRLLRL